MTTQFASGRDSVLTPTVYITSGGNVMGGSANYYFWLQCRSRCGYNFPSSPFTINIPDNSTVSVVIPGTSYYASEDWHEFLVYTSTTNNFTTARLVGVYNALQTDQKTRTTLGSDTPLETDPKQLIFTLDNQINFSSTVINPTALPATPINGARRFVASLSRTYRYSATSTATANGDTVLTAATGRWLFTESNNLIENPINLVTNTNGCNQNINAVSGNPDLLLATYDVSGNIGTPIKYYLKSASNIVVPKGTRITLSVRIDNQDVTEDFSGLLDIIVYGKVRTSNYALVTTNFLSAGSVVPYDHNTRNIILEDDLQPNEYLLLSVTPRFTATDIDTNITPSVGLSLYPYFATDSAKYSDSNITVGDIIFQEGGKRLVIPYGLGVLRVLDGSGCVNLYTWRNKPSDDLTGYSTATAGQSVLVTRTGDVLLGVPTTQRLRRALFSTVSGYSAPCNFSTPRSITAGQTVQYSLQIEQDIDGYNPISATYSDSLLRGLVNKAKLNTNKLLVIVRVDSVYKGFVVIFDPDLTTITGIISDWSAGVTLTVEEINAYNKGLFKPLSIEHTVGGTGGSLPAGSVSVAYCFFYDGTSVSDISHSTQNGCITTQPLSSAKLGARYLYWGEGVANLTELRAVEKKGDSAVETRYVASKRHPYHYDSASVLDDDNDRVIKPTDITASGRWLADNSNAWFTGTTVPSSTIGDYGDWYLRSNTSDLYRKSDAGVWLLNSNIRGLGTLWRSGSGVPSNSLGINGDYYYRVDTADIYTKSAGVYSIIGNIQGAQGSAWRNGSGVPSNSLGVNGDYYLDTDTSSIYAKASNVYTQIGSFTATSAAAYTEITGDLTTISNSSYLSRDATNKTVTLHTPSVAGVVERFLVTGTGQVNIVGVSDSTQLSTLPIDFYLRKNTYIDLVYTDPDWFYLSDTLLRGLLCGAVAKWSFSTVTPLDAEFGAYSLYSLVDVGTIPLTYTIGLLATYALNFDNATADYKLTFAGGNFGGGDTASGILTLVLNYTNSNSDELVISNKITTGGYLYSLRSTSGTNIRFSVTSDAATFDIDYTVADAYTQHLVIASIDTNTNTFALQVDNGVITTQSYTGTLPDYTATEGIVIGEATTGNQFVGIIDRFWLYWRDLDTNQRTLLWNGGSYV